MTEVQGMSAAGAGPHVAVVGGGLAGLAAAAALTARAAMLLAAPGRFSTTKACPVRRVRLSATTRVATSVALPGGKPMITRTERAG
jgi:glycine/D-amino acid oxidase-like deaminating enzyme